MTNASTENNAVLAISTIQLPLKWNRVTLGDISGLVQSIKERGQLKPILIWFQGTTPIVFDGRRRLAALTQLGRSTVKVHVHSAASNVEAFMNSMVANLNSEPNTPYELAVAYEYLVTCGETNDHIARSCGKTSGHVSQLRTALRVASLDRKLLGLFKESVVTPATLRLLAKIDTTTPAGSATFTQLLRLVYRNAKTATINLAVEAYLNTQQPKTKRGAAAHKNKEELNLPDYTQAAVAETIIPVRKKQYQDLLVYQTERVKNADKKEDRVYQKGILTGLELGAGILVLED